MYNPKDKAEEIQCNLAWILRDNGNYPECAKQVSLFCVDEVIKTYYWGGGIDATEKAWWEKVKQEIEKL